MMIDLFEVSSTCITEVNLFTVRVSTKSPKKMSDSIKRKT